MVVTKTINQNLFDSLISRNAISILYLKSAFDEAD